MAGFGFPRSRRDYEPPSLCHWDLGITEALAAVGLSTAAETAAAGTAAATAAEVGTAAAAAGTGATLLPAIAAPTLTAAEAAAGVGTTAAIGGTGLYGAGAGLSLPSLGTVASYAGPALTAGSTLLQMQAAGRNADYQEAVARARAADLEQEAGQKAAGAEQKAIQSDRQSQYVQSQYRARMASSGTEAAGEDTTLADIAGQGRYNTLASLYAGLTGEQADRRQADILTQFQIPSIKGGVLPTDIGILAQNAGTFFDRRAARRFYTTTGETPSAAFA